MEQWTIIKRSEGDYRLLINSSRQMFCRFKYVVSPCPESENLRIEIAPDAIPVTVEWYPHIRQGMLDAIEDLRTREREIVGTRVEIIEVTAHDRDTDVRACKYHGRSFVYDLIEHYCVQIPEPSHIVIASPKA